MKRISRRELFGAAGMAVAAQAGQHPTSPAVPWYRRAYRWGQTNIVEKDPERYDIPWWRSYWKATQVQAVIINAGGIVAYYPSKFPLQHRAQFLNGRDLFGELTRAAHQDGIFVMARMDSNRTAQDFFDAQPGWFARDINGNPYRAGDKYITCINSPYYDEYLPGVLREVIERSHPEGVTITAGPASAREHLLLRELRTQVSRQDGLGPPARGEIGTTTRTGSGFSGTTTGASKSGSSIIEPPRPLEGRIASGPE